MKAKTSPVASLGLWLGFPFLELRLRLQMTGAHLDPWQSLWIVRILMFPDIIYQRASNLTSALQKRNTDGTLTGGPFSFSSFRFFLFWEMSTKLKGGGHLFATFLPNQLKKKKKKKKTISPFPRTSLRIFHPSQGTTSTREMGPPAARLPGGPAARLAGAAGGLRQALRQLRARGQRLGSAQVARSLHADRWTRNRPPFLSRRSESQRNDFRLPNVNTTEKWVQSHVFQVVQDCVHPHCVLLGCK